MSDRERRILPTFVEHTGNGAIETTPYNRLFAERIIFLGTPLDDASANDLVSQLMYLEANDPDRDISLYLNSPGGSLTAMAAVYDTMRYIRPDIATFCLGQAGPAATLLLAAGTAGKRAAVRNARVMLRQPAREPVRGQHSDLFIQAEEMARLRKLVESALAEHTGKTVEQIHSDIERELILDAEQARDYGLIDHVVTNRKKSRLAPVR
ncbi:ATP-dependent Clp protease proteolytic subunit [Pseudonocardia eucalypti]|uniref:ATP-dependent Clp protease proteolytic subunit n=1 Tax=Pseudonocardia eucalypti TaxID=648755 RepID=A0ABP9PTN7_9PSEU|nr:ATP-dependent Clp protease protease subunit [Pseudonocardia eucalypti]